MVSALERPGRPNAQLIGRTERLHIELDRRVTHARRVVGIELQIAIVGGGKGRNAAVAQVVEQGHGQGGPFIGVGPRAEFIKQHQAIWVGLFQNLDNVGHVAAKGAEILLDALLVANIGVDAFKN